MFVEYINSAVLPYRTGAFYSSSIMSKRNVKEEEIQGKEVSRYITTTSVRKRFKGLHTLTLGVSSTQEEFTLAREAIHGFNIAKYLVV